MKVNIYTIVDLAAQTHLKPFCFPTDRDAIQGFKHAISLDDSQYAQAPADYNLLRIGQFDILSGTVCPLDEKLTVARALDLLDKPTEQWTKDSVVQGDK